MDEVDGSSRDTSTDGSSGGIFHLQPKWEVGPLSNCEPLRQPHSSWPLSQPPGELTCNPSLREHNVSWSERIDVHRTNFNHDPAVPSGGIGDQVGCQLAREISDPRSLTQVGERNAAEQSSNNFTGGGGENTKSPETNSPLCQQSGTELLSIVSFREDENMPMSSGLHSGMCRPPPESSNGFTFELRSDLYSHSDRDLDRNNFLPRLENEVSLLSENPAMQPVQQMDLREHLPKPDFTALKETNADRNAGVQGTAACHRSMTGSFVQQCSDVNDFESYSHVDRESYDNFGNSVPLEMRDGYNGAGHLERVIQNQDRLLRSRDLEILELKEANHRQSLFIEKVLSEKRLLESTVVEQARLLMSQPSSTEPARHAVVGSRGTSDLQLYEAQLAAYKEDFENERKEKLLLKGSVDSLHEQLRTALYELRTAQDKLKTTEEELDRYKNPYRAAYQPYLQSSSSHPNRTVTSLRSSQSAEASAAQNKTPLYWKHDQLEPDRVNRTNLTMPSQMDYLSQMTTDCEATVKRNKLTRSDQPRSTELTRLCYRNQSVTATG